MVARRVQIESYTNNKLKIYDQCKRRYYYEYIRKLHWPDFNSNYELGLSVHQLSDYQAKGLNIDKFLKSASDEIIKHWESLKDIEIMKYPAIESEWGFNIRLKDTDYWIEGRIDRLIKLEKEKKHVIIDFKTGQSIPSTNSNDWQSTIYLYAVSIAKNIAPDKMEFCYCKTGDEPEIRKIQYSEDLHKSYYLIIKKKIDEIINTTNWPPCIDCNSAFCQYKKLCSQEEE